MSDETLFLIIRDFKTERKKLFQEEENHVFADKKRAKYSYFCIFSFQYKELTIFFSNMHIVVLHKENKVKRDTLNNKNELQTIRKTVRGKKCPDCQGKIIPGMWSVVIIKKLCFFFLHLGTVHTELDETKFSATLQTGNYLLLP